MQPRSLVGKRGQGEMSEFTELVEAGGRFQETPVVAEDDGDLPQSRESTQKAEPEPIGVSVQKVPGPESEMANTPEDTGGIVALPVGYLPQVTDVVFAVDEDVGLGAIRSAWH